MTTMIITSHIKRILMIMWDGTILTAERIMTLEVVAVESVSSNHYAKNADSVTKSI